MGAIRDYTESFDLAFVIGGMSFIISALMHFVLMWIISKENAAKVKAKDGTGASPLKLDV